MNEKVQRVLEIVGGFKDESDFRLECDALQKSTGLGLMEARAEMFRRRVEGLQDEIRLGNGIEFNSHSMRELHAALKFLNEYDGSYAGKFKSFAEDPKLNRPITPTALNKAEYAAMLGQYQKKFEGAAPPRAIVIDSAENSKLAATLLERIRNDPRFQSSTNIMELLDKNPEIAADFGKIFQAQEAMENHQKHFGKEMKYRKSMERLKIDAKDSTTRMLWGAPTEFVKDVFRGGIRPNFGTFFKVFGATAKFASREVYAGSKLLFSGIRAGASYLDKEFA